MKKYFYSLLQATHFSWHNSKDYFVTSLSTF